MSIESTPHTTPDADDAFDRFSSETTPDMIADQFHGAHDSWAAQLRKNKADREDVALQEHYDKRAKAKRGLKKNSEIKSFKERMSAEQMVYRNGYNRDIRTANEAIAAYEDVSGPEDAQATDMLKQLEEDWARVGGDRYDAAKERVQKYRTLKERMLAKQALKAIGEELVRNMYSEFVSPQLDAQPTSASEPAPITPDAAPAEPEKVTDKKQEFMTALEKELTRAVEDDTVGIFDGDWKKGKLERAEAMEIALSKLTPEEMAKKFASIDRNDEKYLQAGGMWDDASAGPVISTPSEKPKPGSVGGEKESTSEFKDGSTVIVRNDDGSVENDWTVNGEPRVDGSGVTWVYLTKRTDSGSLIRKGVPIDELRDMQTESNDDNDDDYGTAPAAPGVKPRVGTVGATPRIARPDDTPRPPARDADGLDRLTPADMAELRAQTDGFDPYNMPPRDSEEYQVWLRGMAQERARRMRMSDGMDLAAGQLLSAAHDSERPLTIRERIANIRANASRARQRTSRRFDGLGTRLLNRIRESNGGPRGNNPPREQSVAGALWGLYNQIRADRASDSYAEHVVDYEYKDQTRKKKIAKTAIKGANKLGKDLKKRQRKARRR